MAISLVAGLTSVAGAMATAGTLAIGFSTAMTYFAVGAGLSMVSRALMPKPDMGTRLGGIEQTVKKPAMARQLIYGRAKVGGNIVYFDNTGANNRYLHMVIAIAGHEIDAYEKVYFNDEVVWDGSYQGDWADYARIKFYKGDQTSADSDLVSESSGWNNNCKLLDTAYLYVRLDYDQEKFADGVPNISCLVRGKKVLDPRTSTTVWSDNPALCIYDYLRDEKYGLNTSDILVSTVIASANDCETQVDYDDNGTTRQHDKYKLNGVIDTSQKISTNIENMLTAMAGRVVFSGGNFEVHSGKYSTPTVTLDESMVVGDIQFSTKTSRRSTYNGVKGMFLSEELNYTLADYPAQISSTYQTEDGEPLYLDMTLPFTVDNIRAQRLAKLALLKSRQQRTLIMPVSLAGLKLKAGDTVYINNTRLGLSNAPYEVLDYELSYGESLTVNLSLIETASEYYDWNVSDQIDFSVSTDVALYNGTPVAPSNLSLTAGTNLKADGTATGYIDASWTASADAFVDHYIVEYSNGSDKQSIKSNDTAHRITTFNDNQTYTVNVYAVNLINRKSSALSGTVTSVIDTTAPSDITSISISGGLQTIDLSWTNPSDDDFDLVRIKVASTNVEPANHSFEVRADNFTHDIGAYSTTKHYWLAPVDRTGNVGNYVSAGSATTGSIAIDDVPHVAGTFYLTLADNDAPTDAEFSGAVGRNPIEGDVAVVNKAYFFTRGASAWSSVAEFIDGSLLVTDSITATQINTDTVLTEALLANTADITGDLTVTSGKITVQDTDTVINLDPDAQYPFRISQGTEDVVRLGSSTLDPFIKGAFIRGMPVQSINEADLTTFVRNVVGVTSEEKTETETLTHLPTGGNLVYLEADNITTGLTTVLTLESVAGTQSWVYEYADESDWDSGDSAFFNYTLQGYNGTAWEDISGWVNRPVFASGYRISGALVGWSISETYSRTIENNTYTHFRMVVGNMSGEFGGGLHPTSTGINCDFKLTAVTGSQVNSDNYANSFAINDTSGVLTIGRTGSLGDLTADISTYVGNQVSALVDSAPTTLDTLNELANALGDDPNFATTVTTSIGTKANKAGDTFTGFITLSADSGLYQYTENGAYINWDTRDSSISGTASAVIHKWAYKADQSGHAPYYENWWDGNSYHSIGVNGNRWKLSDGLDVGGTITVSGGNSSNWNDAYGWGDHSVENYAVTTGDTFTGDVTFSSSSKIIFDHFTDVIVIGHTNNNTGNIIFEQDGTTYSNIDFSAFNGMIGYYDVGGNGFRWKFGVSGGDADTMYHAGYGGTLIDSNGDYNGTWQGYSPSSFPTAINPTVSGTVLIDNGGILRFDRSGGNAHQRADARLDGSDQARLHWYGVRDDQGTTNFKHAWYDGANYINVTAASGNINFDGVGFNANLQVDGNDVWHSGNDGSGTGLDADLLDGNHGSYYTNWANISGEHRGNITLSFRPTSSTTYAGFQFKNEGGSNAGYLLTRGDSDDNVYASNGITLVSDLDWLTLANRTGSSGIRIMTGTPATVRAEFLDSYINFKTHTNIGNIYQSNDGGWDGRLNISGTRHGRMDVRCTNDGIITSVYSHTGNDRGTVGTLSNHKLGLMANGTTYWYIETDGKLRHKDVSTVGLTEGAIRAKGQIDTADVTNGTFRVYDGSTFRGGFGTARWGIGSAGAVDDMCVFSTGSHIELIVNSGSTRQYVSSSGIELSSGGFYTPNNTRLTDTAVQLYATNGAHVNWDVRPEGNFCVPHKYTYRGAGDVLYGQYKENWWDGDSYHAIAIVNGTFQFGGNIYASGNITAYSDIKVKENIKRIDSALDKVGKLNGYTYDRKDTGNNETGVIAQEVKQVLPQAVIETSEGLSVAYGNMVGLLIESIKELKSEIEELKNGNK